MGKIPIYINISTFKPLGIKPMVSCWIFLSTNPVIFRYGTLPGRTAPGSCSMSPTTGHGDAA